MLVVVTCFNRVSISSSKIIKVILFVWLDRWWFLRWVGLRFVIRVSVIRILSLVLWWSSLGSLLLRPICLFSQSSSLNIISVYVLEVNIWVVVVVGGVSIGIKLCIEIRRWFLSCLLIKKHHLVKMGVFWLHLWHLISHVGIVTFRIRIHGFKLAESNASSSEKLHVESKEFCHYRIYKFLLVFRQLDHFVIGLIINHFKCNARLRKFLDVSG